MGLNHVTSLLSKAWLHAPDFSTSFPGKFLFTCPYNATTNDKLFVVAVLMSYITVSPEPSVVSGGQAVSHEAVLLHHTPDVDLTK